MISKTRKTLLIASLGLIALPIAADAADVTVNVGTKKQEIDGFGASSAWCGTVPDNVMTPLYKTLGFSILRLRIEEGIGDNWKSGPYSSWAAELANAKKAVANGAIVFASPWNPPASLRISGGTNGQYATDPTKWSSYRDYLNAYVKYMKDNGVDLHAISIQNEPDYAKSWTYWSATQIHDFILNYGGTINTKLISAEAFQFNKDLFTPTLNDSKALENVDIIGTHLYGSFTGTNVKNLAFPLFESKARPAGKKIWMTEHYIGEKETDVNIANTVAIGQEIHNCMVTGNMNGYVYWWITWPNGLATGSGTIYQRAYAIGQFSKYIRPGYFRVDATEAPATNVLVSAYAGGDKVVIVVVNGGTGSVNQKFSISGASVSEMATYQTASGKNMVTGSAVTVSGGSFTTSLPAQSITTFVGTNTSAGVALRSNSVNLGFKATLTNGSLLVSPSSSDNSYGVSVNQLNGRQIARMNGLTGATSIPVSGKGIFLVDIQRDGQNQREIVQAF
jgi:glucuronoarabinoxylan endo-1,4-beta-xylanase